MIADERNAQLVVRSVYGPVFELDNWERGAEPLWAFVDRVRAGADPLLDENCRLEVVAPPAVLDQFAQDCADRHCCELVGLEPARLRQELAQLCPH